MDLVGIRVPVQVRDRLNRLARRAGVSSHAYLDRLLREQEATEFWSRMSEVSADDYWAAIKRDRDVPSDDFGREEALIRAEER